MKTTVEHRPLRICVVDDEEPARQRLLDLLKADAGIEVAAVSASGKEAIVAIEASCPDLVFLDVQMPEIDGFCVIEAIGVDRMPPVVFVTAFEEHALRAFEVRALDYLLKPFDRARFEAVLVRARAGLATSRAPQHLDDLSALLDARKATRRDRLLVRDGDNIEVVRTQDLDWIAAAGNYVELHARGKTHLLRATLTALEQRLDPETFLRIHRDTIVHIDRIDSFQRWPGGHYRVVLTDGTSRPIARRYQGRLEARMGKL